MFRDGPQQLVFGLQEGPARQFIHQDEDGATIDPFARGRDHLGTNDGDTLLLDDGEEDAPPPRRRLERLPSRRRRSFFDAVGLSLNIGRHSSLASVPSPWGDCPDGGDAVADAESCDADHRRHRVSAAHDGASDDDPRCLGEAPPQEEAKSDLLGEFSAADKTAASTDADADYADAKDGANSTADSAADGTPGLLLRNDRHGKPLRRMGAEPWREHVRAPAAMASPPTIALEVFDRCSLSCLLCCQYFIVLLVFLSTYTLFVNINDGEILLLPCEDAFTSAGTTYTSASAGDASAEITMSVYNWLNEWSDCYAMEPIYLSNSFSLVVGDDKVDNKGAAFLTARGCYYSPPPGTTEYGSFESLVVVESCQLVYTTAIDSVALGLSVRNSSFPRLRRASSATTDEIDGQFLTDETGSGTAGTDFESDGETAEIPYEIWAEGCSTESCSAERALPVVNDGLQMLSDAVDEDFQVDEESGAVTNVTASINVFLYSNLHNMMRHAKYALVLPPGSGLLDGTVEEASISLAFRTRPALALLCWLSLILLGILGASWAARLWRLTHGKTGRPWIVEWKWLSGVLAAAVLLANPLGLVLAAQPVSVGNEDRRFYSLFAADTMNATGTVLVWLGYWLLADRPRLDGLSHRRSFYLPKVGVTLAAWCTRVASIMLCYPFIWGRPHRQLLAPQSWTYGRQVALVVFAALDQAISLFVVGCILFCTYRSRQILRRLPYLRYRRVQLAFRLYAWLSVIGWVVMAAVTVAGVVQSAVFHRRGGGGSSTVQIMASSQYAERIGASMDDISVLYNT